MPTLEKFIVPIGPQHPALKEPGHFEFTVDGETVTGAPCAWATCIAASRRPPKSATGRRTCICSNASAASARTPCDVLFAGRGEAGRSHRAAARAGDPRAGGRTGTHSQPFVVAGRGRARSRLRYAVHVFVARPRNGHGHAGRPDRQPRELLGQCAGRREVRRGREADRRQSSAASITSKSARSTI